MPLERTHVRSIINTYVKAWQQQDPDLIVTIFTENATYHERVLGEPIRTRESIYRYWCEKVVANQARIECRVLSLYLDGDTAIVEWEVHFDDKEVGARKRMREVAILEFADGLIAALREYWVSEVLGSLGS
jgi:ketosteroid isomerase-like protein